MKKIFLTAFFATLLGMLGIQAQTVYSSPMPLQQDSQDVMIYFDATGTALEGQPASAGIYAHTGYDTAQSKWNAAPTWGTNTDKYKLTYQSENLWMLYIGNINTYYNVPSGTKVTGLDFVFRVASNSPQTQDLFLEVYDEGLQINVSSNAVGNIITPETAYVKLMVNSTTAGELSLSVNGEVIATASNATSLSKEYLFEEPGDYTIVGTVEANGETASETIYLYYLKDAEQVDYPGGTPVMGPVANPDGSVTFCFGAQDKEQVLIVGSWNNYAYSNSQVMNYQDNENGRYFWTTIPDLDPEEMYVYYFVVDRGEYIVGDPYARLILDNNYDKYLDTNVFGPLPAYPTEVLAGLNVPVAIWQTNMNDYDWKVTDFKVKDRQNLMIYELLFRDFTGTEGKAEGNGTVQQAIEKIPYLMELGVNAIEVLPIMEFNGNISWGYNPNFYFAIDKAYGNADDYKEFIDICHQNGIAVILDMVFNQSDGLHPWYQMYKAGQNPYYNLNAPHAYSVLNDWNQGNPMVQEQWADCLKYWMTEYKFDGFRFDLVKGLGTNSSYPNNGDSGTNQYNASRVAEMLYLQSVMMEVNPDAIFINENLASAKEENEMSDTSFSRWGNMQLNWANLNDAACQFAMGYSDNSNLNRLYAVQDGRTWGSTVSYLESHDEQRLAYKQDQWAPSGVKGNVEASMRRLGSTAVQMILTPGSHMIWQFSEMGNAQNTKNSTGGNDTDPKIVNWNLLDEPNHKGLYDNYCELIAIRNANPQFFGKDANFTIGCSASNWNNGRYLYSTYGDQELLTFINPNYSGSSITMFYDFKNKDNNAYKILSQSYNSNASFNAQGGVVVVPANCYVVIGSQDLPTTGVESIELGGEKALSAVGGYGEVNVINAQGVATVYSLDGKVVGSVAGSGSQAVPAGLYIVKCGKDSVKVIVR